MIDCNPLFLPMEVLLSLPCLPNYILLRCLVEDLGLNGQEPIREAIDELWTKHRIRVVRFHSVDHEGQAAGIQRFSWVKALALTDRYLETVSWNVEGHCTGGEVQHG